jgi:heme exporter protein D
MNLIANLGPHADFIVASYAITIVVVAALIVWVWFDHRAQQHALRALEDRGVARRSERTA